jgi:Rrf2 family nitric oxide-sensitive transcriptional repressor
MAIVMCFQPIDASCAIRPCCVLRRALERACSAFVGVLDGYTLDDLVKPKSSLQRLLAIAPNDDNPPSRRVSRSRRKGTERAH